MKTLIIFAALLTSVTAFSAEYKCYGSKYPSDMQHFFADGFVKLSVKNKTVNFKYYYINELAGETTLEIDVNYKLGSLTTGNGQLKGMRVGTLSSEDRGYPGDSISTIHFDESLFVGSPGRSGIIGRFAFPGHGYSYDWNICYNVK